VNARLDLPWVRRALRLPAADGMGLALHVRHVAPAGKARGTVVLVHGATLASGLWDIAVPGYSVMEALAAAGYSAWALDVRGYARSGRLPKPTQAYAGRHDAVADIAATVEHACGHDGVAQVRLVGGSWGSITAACYASEHPQRVAALALMAPIYATPNASWLLDLAEPGDPARLRAALGPTRRVSRADLLQRWDREIVQADKTARRDPRVLDALMRDALDAEAVAATTKASDAFTAPNGTLHDLFDAFSGRPLYNAATLHMPVLLVRGEHDATSTSADAELLRHRLASRNVQMHTVPDAGHFICAECAAPRFQQCLLDFLAEQASGA
jgi:pimeloyl-ACP methyl ester carboxylesterase